MTQGIKAGDIVGYKRNGAYGSYEAKVITVGKRIRIEVLNWCGQPVRKNWFANVSPKRIRQLTKIQTT